MPTTQYIPYTFSRNGSISTTYTDVLLSSAPNNSIIRKSLYFNQLDSHIYLGTIGGGIKLRVMKSDDKGATWSLDNEYISSIAPSYFVNNNCFISLSLGDSETTWFKLQVASLDANDLASNLTINSFALASY